MGRWMKEGTADTVWTRITEVNGLDITLSTVFVLKRTARTTPTASDPAWVAPDTTENLGSIKRVGMLVTGAKVDNIPTKWWVWVKVVDNPEVVILSSGFYTVL